MTSDARGSDPTRPPPEREIRVCLLGLYDFAILPDHMDRDDPAVEPAQTSTETP